MIIRPALPSDIPTILSIYNESVLHSTASYAYDPLSLEEQQLWFERHKAGGYPVLAAEDEGEVVGWSSLSPYHTRIGYRFTAETSLYIAPEYQYKGLGKRMLSELIDSAMAMKLHALIALIDSENAASVRLHAGFGFVEAGRLREVGYKFDRWLDLILMQLLII